MQPKREFAYLWGSKTCGYAERDDSGNVSVTTRRSSKQNVVTCHYRYPSPRRSAFAQGGPASFFRSFSQKNNFDIGYQTGITIECGSPSAATGAYPQLKIGKIKCIRNQSSSQQLQFSAWLAAWTQILSAALPVQVLASWPQMFWALIQRVQHLLVPLLASCVTTQASAAQHAKTPAHIGRQNQMNRRRGVTPAAVFCLGDG